MTVTTRENSIHYLELQGTPYDMGQQHGTALKNEVIQAVADYRANVETMFGQENARKVFDWALNQARFRKEIEGHAPALLEELGGIADAAGIALEDMILLNMFEEVYEAAPMRLGLAARQPKATACTAFTARSKGRRFAGQNMDYSSNLQEKQLVVRYRYPDRQLLLYCFVGQVGGLGVNSKGLSVFINTLPQGRKRADDGLGSNSILRLLLEQDSVADALDLLRKVPRFGGANYTLTDLSTGMVVEADADEVIPRLQTDEDWAVVGTNHALCLKHRHDMPGAYEDGEPVPYSVSLTLERMGYAQSRLDEAEDSLTVDGIKGILTSTPVNIYNTEFMTLQSAIVEYGTDRLAFHASAGYDPLRGWNEYRL